MYQILLDPPKSPLKRGTLRGFPPFKRGARGDQSVPKITAYHFSNILLSRREALNLSINIDCVVIKQNIKCQSPAPNYY
jgi:hypothetical protein